MYLLSSFDPAKKGNWYDRRNYYDHHTGLGGNGMGYFPKKELIQKDVAAYFQIFFRLEQLNNPLLKDMRVSKESFCKNNDLTAFAARSKRKRDVYTGSAAEDCAKALAQTCENLDQIRNVEYQSLPLEKNNEFDSQMTELFDTEGRYKASIDEVLAGREVLLRSLEFALGAESANSLFGPVFLDLAELSIKSGILLERIRVLNQEMDSKGSDQKTIEALRIFSAYFDEVTPLYQRILKPLIKELPIKISDMRKADENSKIASYLAKLDQYFFSKMGQRVGRYTVIFEGLKKTLEKDEKKLETEDPILAKKIGPLLVQTIETQKSAATLAISAL